ncbi:hypothetical protein MBLNU459_g2425t2 [Dothideomycetes sp. NU459]
MTQFFEGRKTHKTMQLIALRVICACRSGSGEIHQEALTSVILANNILAAVAEPIRTEWCNKNPAIVRKLQEKCLVQDLTPDIRFQALTFMGALPSSIALPSQAISSYGKLLTNTDSVSIPQEQFEQSLDLALHRYAPLFDSRWWQDFLSTVVDAAISKPSSLILGCSSRCAPLLKRLTVLVEEFSSCREATLAVFAKSDVRQKLEALDVVEDINTRSSLVDGSHDGVCPSSVSLSREDLAKSLCTLILQSGLSAQSHATQPPNRVIKAALHRHGQSSMSDICSHRNVLPGKTYKQPHLVEVESTPVIQNPSIHWRTRLTMSIQAHAMTQEQALMASFAEMCRDLERRCENVEEPLRMEKEKTASLQSRHEALAAAYSNLESQILDRDLRISALEADNDRQSSEMEAASIETQDLMRRIDQAARELEESNKKTREILTAAKQEKHELELKQATALACKQEMLDQFREQAQNREQELHHHLHAELGRMAEDRKQDTSEQVQLRSDVGNYQKRLHETEERLSNIENERHALAGAKIKLDHEMVDLRRDAEQQRRELENAHTLLEDTKSRSMGDISKAAASFEDTMAKNKREWTSIKEALERQIAASRHELEQAERELQEQHQTSKQKISELRKRIDRLTKECHAKDAQVLEMQERWNRMMMVVGQPLAPPPESLPKSSTLPYRSASTIATPKPSSQPAHQTPRDQAQTGDDEDGDFSFASSVPSSAGPTPKRARSRPQIASEAVQQRPRASFGPRSARSTVRARSAMKRQPLLDICANRSPSKIDKSPSKVAFKDISTAERRDMEEWSFTTTDGVLTSTPGKGLKNGQDLDDMSTADV